MAQHHDDSEVGRIKTVSGLVRGEGIRGIQQRLPATVRGRRIDHDAMAAFGRI